MKIDIATLIGAMQQGRVMQKRDVSVSPPSPKAEAILNKHIDNLKSQLDARDSAMQGLKDELEKALYERDMSMDELDDTKHEPEGVQAELVEAKCEWDAAQIEV
ncbi:hypothetical protein EOD39_14729 [Acipenser ruthenus]|uniref:Uncharacterized protein n=1 Tax=Acipenser ruthenus TaxID=7906 RepID=A0A444UF29_ACIRT|nr:hypothetical protein EOD39_14729 [Acipenser ruthenus]